MADNRRLNELDASIKILNKSIKELNDSIIGLTKQMKACCPGNWFQTARPVLLLHCNGSDGSTTFTDSSPNNHTVTANGNAQIDTAQSKFGGASALFDGTGDFLEIADSADWHLGSGDFTIDFWVRYAAVSTVRLVCTDQGNIDGWRIVSTTTSLSFGYFVGGIFFNVSKSWTPSTNTWYHIAAERYGNSLSLFVDGVKLDTSGTISVTISDPIGPLTIGALDFGGNPLNGWIDEVRIVKGTAVYKGANFTPPISEYS